MDGKQFFRITNQAFFKPLTGKFRGLFLDCILKIYEICQNEQSYSYSSERNLVIDSLQEFFENDDSELILDGDTVGVRNSRDKANRIVRQLKACGWIDEETRKNHETYIQLNEFAIPFIKDIIGIIQNDELEYQGVIANMVMLMKGLNEDRKPYENIVKGVQSNMDKLVTELKRLNSSIKRKLEDLTSQMTPEAVLDSFESYNEMVISKSYYRLKTSDNISTYREGLKDALDRINTDQRINKLAITGYIEVNSSEDKPVTEEDAREALLTIVLKLKNSLDHLDDIIRAIDEKNRNYTKSALNRAKILLSAGYNIEGRVNQILKNLANDDDFDIETSLLLNDMFAACPQRYISDESIRNVSIYRQRGKIAQMQTVKTVSEEVKQQKLAELRKKQENILTRKKIDDFVKSLLGNRDRMNVAEIPVNDAKDFFSIIYIVIYANKPQNCYRIERHDDRIVVGGKYRVKSFDIVKRRV